MHVVLTFRLVLRDDIGPPSPVAAHCGETVSPLRIDRRDRRQRGSVDRRPAAEHPEPVWLERRNGHRRERRHGCFDLAGRRHKVHRGHQSLSALRGQGEVCLAPDERLHKRRVLLPVLHGDGRERVQLRELLARVAGPGDRLSLSERGLERHVCVEDLERDREREIVLVRTVEERPPAVPCGAFRGLRVRDRPIDRARD